MIDSEDNVALTNATIHYNSVTTNVLEPLVRSGKGVAVSVNLKPGERLMTAVCTVYDVDWRFLDAETIDLNEGTNRFFYTPRVAGAKIAVFAVNSRYLPLLPCQKLALQ